MINNGTVFATGKLNPHYTDMKKLLFLSILLMGLTVYGQTDSLEKAAIYNKLISKQIEPTEFTKTWKAWCLKFKTEKYPELPLDQNGQVHYVYVRDFKGRQSEYLFNRTMEWLAVNYGVLPSGMYSNEKDGRIILKLNLNLISNFSCTPTVIISIKNEKLKYELMSVSYQLYISPDYQNGVPERTVGVSVFPVVLMKPNEWNIYLSVLKETTRLFNTEVQNLTDYIQMYDNSENF